MTSNRVFIAGAGGFGCSLAVLADRYGCQVTLWSKFQEEIDAIRRLGENKRLLPGVPIPPTVNLTTDLSEAAQVALVILAVPSVAVRDVAKAMSPSIRPGSLLVNVGKGLEPGTLKRLSQVIREELPNCRVAVLSGPSHAEEVARGVPTTVAVASEDRASAQRVQDILSCDTFRIYVNDDVVGTELGGALKNIIAVAAGICDGMELGDNAKAALMTRGIVEMSRLGVALGGRSETFGGLTGIGDLIVTCMSMHSRNRRAGILIGQGISPKVAVEKVGTVEGYVTTQSAYRLARQMQVEMPILEQLYAVLYEEKDVLLALRTLMGRPVRHESEDALLALEK